MTLYYYMYRSWQDCCRREENRSWPSVSVESVDSECWCLNNTIVYAFIMRLTVEECVLRSTFKLNNRYLHHHKTVSPLKCMSHRIMLWGFLSQPVHGTATYRCDDIRCCIIKFWPPDDEHIVLETCKFCYVPVHILSQPVHRTATYRCDDTRCCIIQFWPPEDEHNSAQNM